MTNKYALLNCPFCGGKAKVVTTRYESYGYDYGMRGVCCQNPVCGANGKSYENGAYDWGKRRHYSIDADKLATEWWNRRAKI